MGTDHIAHEGEKVIVEFARRADGSMPAKEYFEGLAEADQVRISRVWAMIGREPFVHNKEKFKVVEGQGNLQEIKSFQARMFTAWAPTRSGTKRRLLLLSGLKRPKKKDKLSEADIKRACEVRDEHMRVWESKKEKKSD